MALQMLWNWLTGKGKDGFERLAEVGRTARVAVVGAGVGGAAAAYFLKESLGAGVQIDVFEKGKIGGRAESFEYEGQVYELGAAIIYKDNKYIRDIADKVGAKRVKVKKTGSRMSLYDGERIVFQTAWLSLVSLYRIVRRYGWMPFKYGKVAKKEFFGKFKKIYGMLRQGEAFHSPKDMWEAVGMYASTQISAKELFEKRFGDSFGSSLFRDEFAAAVNRVNYNQGMRINAFAGLVSYLPAADNNLFKIKRGNSDVCLKMLEHANAKVITASVMSISKIEGTGVSFEIETKEMEGVHDSYDAVVIASPLETLGADLKGVQMPKIPPRKFQTTVTTYIRGKLKPSYFDAEWLPKRSAVYVTEQSKAPFSSVAFQRQFPDGTQLFKVFSSTLPDPSLWSKMFQDSQVVMQREWLAYPIFETPEKFSPFVLSPGVYYNNAMENVASALEMSAIAAKNSANLVLKYLRQKYSRN